MRKKICGYVRLVFVGTKDQLADLFTKVLDISTFTRLCKNQDALCRQ